MYICKYCGRECKNANSLRNHERLCKMNPNRQISPFVEYNKNRIPWNKGLTKETDERVRKNGLSIKNKYDSGEVIPWQLGLTKETDERIAKISKKVSDTVNSKVEDETWHSSIGKVHHYECNGYLMHGTWELALANYLNSKNIKWERPKDKFKYYFNKSWHWYHPDIYLIDYDIYIEVKGCITEKDLAKWEQFPKDKKLDIYFGDDFSKLNIIPDAKTKGKKEIIEKIKKYIEKHLNINNI